MRKDFGAKPMRYPMPVRIIGTYAPVYHNYVVLGKLVGKAFSDGKKLK